MQIKKEFGLIGGSLKNSFSKDYFNKKFQENNLPFYYHNFELKNIDEVYSLIAENANLYGLNVTIPFKERVIPLLNELDKSAAEIGAVNCIKINRENDKINLIGFNTDAFGFEKSLIKFIPQNFTYKALILGTGGASKAVQFVCKQLNIDFTLVSSSNGKLNTIGYESLNENVFNTHKLIVNTTPLGMFPYEEGFPLIPYNFINSTHYCFDLIYLPLETNFLKTAKIQNAKIMNGLAMLNFQAEKAYSIFVK